MMDNPKISIIVPVYNAENYLADVVSSTLNQTFSDFELIFINDGSTDGSLTVLKSIQETDFRIKLLSQENKGVTAARKLGWENSIGEYVTFLDADDSLYANSLELLINELEQESYDIVNGSFISVPSGKQWIHKKVGVMDRNNYLETFMLDTTYGVIYASLYNRTILKDSTFAFDKTIKIGEDVLMNIELCSRVNKVKNITAFVYKYTDDNSNSAMKIIVRHPSYYKRFYAIRNSLFKSINLPLYKKNQHQLELKDNSTMIKAFFSPYVDFDLVLFRELQQLRTQVPKRNLFYFSLSNKYLTQLIKNGIFILHSLKGNKGRKIMLN